MYSRQISVLFATQIAGTGTSGSSLSEMSKPSGVAVDKKGTYLYVADNEHHRNSAVESDESDDEWHASSRYYR